MLTSELRPVITDLIIPNGIAFDRKETTLYVTDTSPDTGISIVYAYDLNKDALPVNRRIFSVSSLGIPDGIRVDKNDRVWIAEGDGINVRDRRGTLLGVILGHGLCANGVISNFAMVKNTIIILAQESLWRLNIMTDVL
jgi:gluconolactonase